jgi:hypothetical protein
MALILFRLSRRWNQRVAIAAAIALAGDALITPVEAATFNVRRAKSFFDYAIIAMAVVGPPIAVAVLWGGVTRHRRRSAA